LFEQNLALTNYKRVLFGESLCARSKFPDRQSFWIYCAAKFFNWTHSASRSARETNERAKIHERGVVNARGALWNKRGGVLPERFLAGGLIDRTSKVENTRQNTSGIGFDNRRRLVKRETGDGVRGVFSDSGKLLHLLN